MEFNCIVFRIDGPIASITLNRPDKLNAIGADMVAELHRALDDTEASPRVRVITLQGSGRSFCSGFDLSELQIGAAAAETRKVLEQDFRIIMRSWNSTKPTLAAVHGYALGGGLTSVATASDPMALSDLMQSQPWSAISAGHIYEFQSMNFQPVGGMGMIGKAFGRELGELIRYNANVTEIKQDSSGVTVTYQDTRKGGPIQTAEAQWCLCTIPASILGQIPMNVAAPMKNAIASDRRDLSDYGRGKWPARHAAVRRIAQG